MLEKDIESRVCKYAKKLGVMTYKFSSPARASVPDRVFVYPHGKIIFIEFKRTGEEPTSGQFREINRLINHGQTVYVVDDVAQGKLIVDLHQPAPVPVGGD